MSHTLTLELSDELVQKVRRYSAAQHRRLEDVAVDLIGRAIEEPTVESLADCTLEKLPLWPNTRIDELLPLRRPGSPNI